jgi:TetR/AcrR family transcriptional repressor of nem operon
MQPAGGSSASPRRGRPRSFDLDEVTAAALRVLWAQGYEATSVEDLVAGTGLSLSSLYGAFGSKRGVLDAALARYEQDMETMIVALEHGSSGLDDVTVFLDVVRGAVRGSDLPAGCFMVNTMVEVAPIDPGIAALTSRYRERLHHGITAALRRAARSGEISRGTATDRARLIQAAVFGMLVTARAGAPDAATAQLNGIRSEIRRWRREQRADHGSD